MYDEWYNPLFKVANELYGSNVYSYYFDIPFEETIRRHQTRSKSQEFGEEHMRGWWRKKDFSAVLKEQLITCEMDANSIVATDEVAQVAWMNREQIKELFDANMFVDTLEYFFTEVDK